MSSPTDEPAELENPVAEDPEAHEVELPRLPRCHRDNDTFIDDVQGRNAHETIWGHKPEQYPQPEPTDEWFDWYMPEDQEGAWQCGAGHMFRYEPPPAWPPWCFKPECDAGNFRWIIKDEVTSRDWLPDETPTEYQARVMNEVIQRHTDQVAEKHYTDMVHRNPDGSDPLVEEPGP